MGNKVIRSEFITLAGLIILLFLLGRVISEILIKHQVKLITILFLALVCRLILINSSPKLSDDYYRYYWDGKLMHHQINPYLYTPENIRLSLVEVKDELYADIYKRLNSKDYFTVYPPAAQAIFYVSAFGNLYTFTIIMRIIIIICELLTIWLLYYWLSKLQLSKFNLYLFYVFNPYFIIEFTGNLHLESITLLFMLTGLYFIFEKENILLSSILISVAVCIKLLPAIVLPFIIKKLGLKKGIIYTGLVLIVCLILFVPFNLIEIFRNYLSGIDLFIRKFEFNASIYYVLNYVTSSISGFNTISYLSPFLMLISLSAILYLVFASKIVNTIYALKSICLAYLIYYLFSTTVHPWYLSLPMCLAIFSNIKAILVWPLLAMLSYSFYGDYNRVYYYAIFIEYIYFAFLFFKDYKYGNLNLR